MPSFRLLLPLALAILIASPAQALLHIIDFSDSSVTGSFDVDLTGLNPGDQVSCNTGPPCDFASFEVVFSGGEFALGDVTEVLLGNVGPSGTIESLFVLMLDTAGTGSNASLDMDDDPNTFSINPSGTYTITAVPEPGTALLLGLGLTALAARRRA